jgi:hypothetical protein
VRDGINLALRSVPTVALITEPFWAQSEFVSRSLGMPDIPRIKLPHPVAGVGHESMSAIAAGIAPAILQVFATGTA